MQWFSYAGLLATLSACACVYLGSSNQRWRARSWPRRFSLAAGTMLLVLGWFGLAHDAQGITATFTVLVVVMLAFTLMPYLGAYLDVRRNR